MGKNAISAGSQKPGTSEERELVQRAKEGDTTAFDELVNRCRKRLVYQSMVMVGSKADAEDIVQEVCLKAYQDLSNFRGDCAFSSWLSRSVFFRSLSRLRDDGRSKTVWIEELAAQSKDGESLPVEFGTPSCVLEDLIELEEFEAETKRTQSRVRQLRRYIPQLPPGYRRMVELHLAGLSFPEMSEKLGRHVGNCKSQFYQALECLRERFAGLGPRKRGRKPDKKNSTKKRLPELVDATTIASPDMSLATTTA